MIWLVVHLILYGTSGFQDETLSGYADRAAQYQLVAFNDQAVPTSASIAFPNARRVRARTACFDYDLLIQVPLPWFAAKLKERAEYSCLELPFEAAFIQALQTANFAEVAGDVILLTGPDDLELVFKAQGQ